MKLLTPRRHIAFEPFLTPAELAEALRVHKSTVTRKIQAGEIVAMRFGKSLRIKTSEIDRYQKFGPRKV